MPAETLASIPRPVGIDVNGEFTASVVMARCGWRIKLDTVLPPEITVAVRIDRGNVSPLDYCLLPRIDMPEPKLRLAGSNSLYLESYRF